MQTALGVPESQEPPGAGLTGRHTVCEAGRGAAAWSQAAHCLPLSGLSVVNMFSSSHFGIRRGLNSRL